MRNLSSFNILFELVFSFHLVPCSINNLPIPSLNCSVTEFTRLLNFGNLVLSKIHNSIFQQLLMVLSIVIRYDSVGRANQELVGIHNDAAQEELVEIYRQSLVKTNQLENHQFIIWSYSQFWSFGFIIIRSLGHEFVLQFSIYLVLWIWSNGPA